MSCLVLDASDVRRLLPMRTCIDLVADALATLARGDAVNPLRHGIRLPQERGLLGLMPAYLGAPPTFGLKVVSVFPGNHGTAYDSHQGAVMLFEVDHGCPVAVIDAGAITAIRTAAASAVATRLLAREHAGDLAILGTGIQARSHLEAMAAVRPIQRARVYSRSPEHRAAFVKHVAAWASFPVEATDAAEAAVAGAEIICTTTSSSEPVLRGEWLTPGVHVNAVGSSVRHTRELDTQAIVRSRLFVDRVESTVNEAGDYLFPLREGAIDETHIVGEIGDVLVGRLAGRGSPEEITVFKSLGLAIEDLAAAYHVHRKALETGAGTEVALGGAGSATA